MPVSVPTLENEVVRLQPLQTDHVPQLVRAADVDRSSYGYSTVPRGEAEMAAYVEHALQSVRAGTAWAFAIQRVEDGDIVGTTRYWDMTRYHWRGARPDGVVSSNPDSVEIGYTWLTASAQRTAVNTACKLLLLTYAFEQWGVQRVMLKTDERNQRSRAAIERLGGKLEGILRAHMAAADGGVRNTAMYSLLPSEWSPTKRRLEERLRRAG